MDPAKEPSSVQPLQQYLCAIDRPPLSVAVVVVVSGRKKSMDLCMGRLIRTANEHILEHQTFNNSKEETRYRSIIFALASRPCRHVLAADRSMSKPGCPVFWVQAVVLFSGLANEKKNNVFLLAWVGDGGAYLVCRMTLVRSCDQANATRHGGRSHLLTLR
jgi:hypothetical protein